MVKYIWDSIKTILWGDWNLGGDTFHYSGPGFGAILILILIGYSIYWIYKDASSRNRNPFLAVIFILTAGWPLSFLWWIWLRPSKIR